MLAIVGPALASSALVNLIYICVCVVSKKNKEKRIKTYLGPNDVSRRLGPSFVSVPSIRPFIDESLFRVLEMVVGYKIIVISRKKKGRKKRKTYQRLETRLRLEPLSLSLCAMVMVVTVGLLLLSVATWRCCLVIVVVVGVLDVVFGVVFVSVVVILNSAYFEYTFVE
jgi:hypothetical protein